MAEIRISGLSLTTKSLDSDYYEIARLKNGIWSSWRQPITSIVTKVANSLSSQDPLTVKSLNIFTVGKFYSSSDDLYIENIVKDKDIIFNINDDGTKNEILRMIGATSTIKTEDDIILNFGNLSITSLGSEAILSCNQKISIKANNNDLVLKSGGLHAIKIEDGNKLAFGTGYDGQIYSSGDNLYIDNVTQDKDIIIRGNDGGVQKTIITIDSSLATDGSATTDAPICFERNFTVGSTDYTYIIPAGANSYAFSSAVSRSAGVVFNSISAYIAYRNTSANETIKINAASTETYFRVFDTTGFEVFEVNGNGYIEIHGPADVGQEILYLEQLDIDQGFIDFKGNIAGNTTSTISSLTTSGATTHHLKCRINGVGVGWIAISTNNPS
jgi:hypothetical protein